MSRTRHMAKLISEAGVSALCFERPHAIDMRRTSWTTDPDAVSCKACKAKLTAPVSTKPLKRLRDGM